MSSRSDGAGRKIQEGITATFCPIYKFDTVEKLLADPSLFKSPVVRDQKRATAGFHPDIWKKWLAAK